MSQSFSTGVSSSRYNSYSYSKVAVPLTSATGTKNINYTEVYNNATPESSASTTKNVNTSVSNLWKLSMGQNRNFVFCIPAICSYDNNFKYNIGNDKSQPFLPLKSIDFKPVSFEHLKIKAGVFTDMPFFYRMQLGRVSCVMHDSTYSYLAEGLLKWFSGCVNSGGYVPYVDDMCYEAYLTEYSVDGKSSIKYSFVVMPDGEISTSKSYENDALNEYKFELLIVSDVTVTRRGAGATTDAYGIIVSETTPNN